MSVDAGESPENNIEVEESLEEYEVGVDMFKELNTAQYDHVLDQSSYNIVKDVYESVDESSILFVLRRDTDADERDLSLITSILEDGRDVLMHRKSYQSSLDHLPDNFNALEHIDSFYGIHEDTNGESYGGLHYRISLD